LLPVSSLTFTAYTCIYLPLLSLVKHVFSVENLTIVVTSNSPVVYGSLMVFHAEVAQSTEKERDEKRFRFEWKSNVHPDDVVGFS